MVVKRFLLLGLLLIALVGLPLTVYIFQRQTNTQSHASAGTTLSLIPEPGPDSSIQKNVNDDVPIDLMVDPGSNAVTLVRLQVHYDPTKLDPVGDNPFTPSPPTSTFPALVILDGPVINNGTISELISIGSNISKAIKTPTKLGTFHFKAINATADNEPTIFAFTNETQAFSSSANDQAGENILSNTNPASITIIGTAVPTDTPIDDTPTNTPTPTKKPTPTNTPTPGPITTNQFTVTAFLHAIGNSGDNTNPTGTSLSNKNPLTQPRDFTLSIYNSNDQLVLNKKDSLDYDSQTGNFSGTIDLGQNLTAGNYIIRIKTDSFLQKRIPGFLNVLPSKKVVLPAITLVAGDANNDNALSILDYNMIIGCYSDFQPAVACNDTEAVQTDFNDDGHVNQIDYNLFLRELTVQNGN